MEKKTQKIINAWSVTHDHGNLKAGDIVIISNIDGLRRMDNVRNHPWYFYVERTDGAMEILDGLKKQGYINNFNKGKRYIKVWADKKLFNDKDLKDVIRLIHSKGIKTFEADVGPAKRYLLDKGFEIEDFDKINLFYFDIETDDSEGKIEYETNGDFSSIKAKDRILSIAFVDREGESWFLHSDDEKELLVMVNDFLKRSEVDMLVGWNSKDFDIPYLWKRMAHHGIKNSYMRNILHEDMMRRVQYFYSKDPEARQSITNYSLNNISKYFINESKVEREGKVIDLYKEDFEKFKEYNIQDAQLLRKLEDKLGLIRLTYQMFQICRCTAQNWSMIKAIDNFILYEANQHQIHYPTNKAYLERAEEQDQYLGALVLDPIPGYYENVYDLDFKSLYPNIIRTFNISPETLSPRIGGLELIETPGVEINGEMRGKVLFDKKEGIIPRKIKLLLEEREKIRLEQKKVRKDSQEWRDLNVKQLVVKELANSIYGVLGNIYFRSYDRNVAESITATGQYLILYLKKLYEDRERKVIYGDTDSVFVQLRPGENIDEVLVETNRELTKHLKEKFGVIESSIELALDKVFDKFLIEGKKKYVGETEGKMKFVGMESVKRDTIPIAKKAQEALIDIIFRTGVKDLPAFIEGVKYGFMNGSPDIKDILIHKKMAKNASSYMAKSDKKYTPPLHVRIALELKVQGDKTDLSKAGSIISYIITKGDPLEGVHISEYKGEYDKEYYWNKAIYPMLERVLKVAIPDVDWDKYYIIKEKVKRIKKDGINTRRRIGHKERRKSSSVRAQRSGQKSIDNI